MIFICVIEIEIWVTFDESGSTSCLNRQLLIKRDMDLDLLTQCQEDRYIFAF